MPVRESTLQRQDGFPNYDLQLFDDLEQMRRATAEQDSKRGFGRLVVGYAWEWKSKRDPTASGIDRRCWTALEQHCDRLDRLGGIGGRGRVDPHRAGYDLNCAGVIIGPDLRFDPIEHRLVFDRASYADKRLRPGFIRR